MKEEDLRLERPGQIQSILAAHLADLGEINGSQNFLNRDHFRSIPILSQSWRGARALLSGIADCSSYHCESLSVTPFARAAGAATSLLSLEKINQQVEHGV